MKVILGTPVFAVPKPWHYFEVPAIMVNAYDMLTKNVLARGETTIHELLQCDIKYEIWIDSGGYQFLRHGIEPPLEKIVQIYRRFGEARYFLNVDYPPSPQDDENLLRKKLEKSYRNYVKLLKEVEGCVVPVLHYHYREDIVLEYLKKYLEHSPEIIAVGALVPYVLILRGVKGNSRLRALSFLKRLVDEVGGKVKIHVLGLGSPIIIPILEAIGVSSTDSSTWRVKAAYGKIVLPGGGEIHVTNRRVNFGKRKATESDLAEVRSFLVSHGFPLVDRFDLIYSSFEYRALVNAFIVVHSRVPPRSSAFRKIWKLVCEGRLVETSCR